MLTIGIIGTDRGVGSTHFAVSVATKLKAYYKKICVYSPSNRHLGLEVGEIDEDGEGEYFTYRNIDYLLTEFPIAFLAKEYEVAILEYGTNPTEMFPQTQFQFIVSGGREWNRGGEKLLNLYAEYPHAYYVFPFATDKEEFRIDENINLIFPEYEVNPFAESKLNLAFITEERTERGLFSLFRRADKKKIKSMEESISKLTDEFERKQFEQAELTKKIEEERREALTDELTGCFNRKAFVRDISEAKDFVLICFDINCLKEMNDTYGHEKGDALILSVTGEIKKRYNKVYRMGGDEFNVITDKATFRQEDLKSLDDTLKDFTERNGGIIHQVAYGFASNGECENTEELLRLADKRMYDDKARKKSEISKEKERENEEREKKARETEEALLRVEQEVEQRRLEAEAKRKEEEDNGLIATTSAETDDVKETGTRKDLSTMWFAKKEIEYQEGYTYHNDTLYIFPTEYRKALVSLPLLVVKETDGEYEVFTGTNVKINNVDISARFMRDGTLKVTTVSDTAVVSLVSEEIHNGIFTPKNFGKKVDEGELYPIRQNISGTCDCVLLVGKDKATVVKGMYKGHALTLSDKEFRIQAE